LKKEVSNHVSFKSPVDRDLFNLEEPTHPDEEEEEDIDWSLIEPSKVNWFKFILDKHLRLTDDDGNLSALNTPHAVVNLLNILLT
jgi:hypothetical protein